MANRLNVLLRSCVGLVVGVGMTLILAHGARDRSRSNCVTPSARGRPCSTVGCSPLPPSSGPRWQLLRHDHRWKAAGGGAVFKLTAAGTVVTLTPSTRSTDGYYPAGASSRRPMATSTVRPFEAVTVRGRVATAPSSRSRRRHRHDAASLRLPYRGLPPLRGAHPERRWPLLWHDP